MRKTPAVNCGRTLEDIILEYWAEGRLRNPEQSLRLLGSGADLPSRDLVRPLGGHDLLDSITFFQRPQVIVWCQRVEQSARSTRFQYCSSSTAHPSNHETSNRLKVTSPHLNRKFLRESWLIAVQPINFISRSNSACIRASARSTPAWPAAVDWVRPQGYTDLLGGHLLRNSRLYAWLSVRRATASGTYSATDTRSINRVAQQLRRVLKLRYRLRLEQAKAHRLSQCLDEMGFAIYLVDANAKVLATNKAGDEILRTGEGIKCCNGRLVCEGSPLRRAIHSAAQPALSQHAVASDFTVLRSNRHPLEVHVIPLPTIEVPGAVAVLVIDTGDKAPDIDGFSSAHSLTRAERQVLGHIVRGEGLVGAARKLGIAEATARTHLQHVFAKTHAKTQVDIVRMVMMSPLKPRSKV